MLSAGGHVPTQTLAPAELAQAELSAQRADRAAAARHYRRFLALWKDCDPLLRPAMEAARRRLAELDRPAAGNPG